MKFPFHVVNHFFYKYDHQRIKEKEFNQISSGIFFLTYAEGNGLLAGGSIFFLALLRGFSLFQNFKIAFVDFCSILFNVKLF